MPRPTTNPEQPASHYTRAAGTGEAANWASRVYDAAVTACAPLHAKGAVPPNCLQMDPKFEAAGVRDEGYQCRFVGESNAAAMAARQAKMPASTHRRMNAKRP